MMSMLKIQRSNELLLLALMFVLCVFGNNCFLFAQPQRISAATTTTTYSGESAGASQSTNVTATATATATTTANKATATAATNGAIKENLLVNSTTNTAAAAAAAANQKQQHTQRKQNGESVGAALESSEADGADKQPTTYRPGGRQPSIAPHNSAQERERKLMNVLAARRSALHRGGFRARIGTTGRTATAAAIIETTSKSPTDPRSVCIRNCTKNFTRRTTASCMRQCANFSRMTTNANANGPTIFVRQSSKTGTGEAPVERDTNEILFSDESSHGLFVVAKEQNDTVNHIPDALKMTSGAKVRTRGKPAAAQTVTLATTSIEDDDLQPYVYFGQKLPPIRPGALTITAVSDEHPRLLEVSAAPSSTSAAFGATATTTAPPIAISTGTLTTKRALTAVERSRSHYKYNMRKAAPQSFHRQRYVGSGRPTVGLNDNSAEVKAVVGNVNSTEEAITPRPKLILRDSVAAMKMTLLEAPNPEQMIKPVAPTPLIINVQSEEEEVTMMPSEKPKVLLIGKSPKVPSSTTTTTTTSTTTTTIRPRDTSTTTTTTSTTPATTTTSTTTTTTTTTTPASTTTTSTSTALPKPPTTLPTTTTTTTSSTTTPKPTTTSTTKATTTATTPTPTPVQIKTTTTKPKSIIEEDTDRLRALGPSLTQKINIEDQNNLVVFCNSTADCEGGAGSSATGTTASYSKIIRTLVLSSVRSTVYPPTSTMKPPTQYIGIAESAGAEPKQQQTTASTATLDISSTAVTDESEVSAEIRRMNLVNMVLSLVGLVPLVAIVVYLVRNYVLRRRAKHDEVFDVCITDQQPISPVTKIDSKHSRENDDEDEVDHHIMHHGKMHATRDSNHNHRYDDVTSLASEYQEFNSSKIRLKSLLGEGNFGQVWKAEADDLSGHFGATRIVAVKTIRACSAQASLKDEANIMRKLGSHMNVVTLLGACVESEPHMLIMEYAMRGRLLSLLRAARSANNILPASVPGGRSLAPLSPRTLAGFALDIACGMEYIAERRIVHRDLAARNILLDHNGICKICDFGMSIDLDAERKRKEQEKNAANDAIRNNAQRFRFDFGSRYIIQQWQNNFGHHHQHHNGQCANSKSHGDKKHHGHGHGHDTIGKRHALPIRWMAPEALQFNIFTTETDIWAFGIVLWEIATLGSTPYAHLTGREVIRRVPNGLRPDLPKESRHEFYNLMSRCWHKDSGMRPSFSQSRLEITRSLHKWVDDDSAASDYMDVSGFSEDLEHGVVYFNHRISEFECEI